MNHRSIFVNTIALVLAVLVITGCGGAESRKAKYMEKGKAYIEQKNYDKAKVELRNVLQIDPKLAEAYYLIGLIEEEKQEWSKAMGSYLKAVELNPDYLEARAKVGRYYLLMGNVDMAAEQMDAILSRQPGNYLGRSLKAAIMANKGDIDGAVREISSVVAEQPSSVEAIYLLSSLYIKQEKQDKAIEVVTKGITLNPKDLVLRFQLITIYDSMKIKDLKKIEQVMQEIAALEPKNMLHRASLASFYARINQLDKAEKTLRDAIQESPDDEERYLLLADFMAARKGVGSAEAELLGSIKSNPKAYKLRFGLAKLYEQTGAIDKVSQVYKEIIDIDGDGKDGLQAKVKLAALLFRQGQRSETSRLVDEVLKENPGDNEALIIKGKLALLRNDTEGAIAAFRTVLRDQPNSVEAYALLASAHLQKKEPELAKESLSKAVEMNPTNTKARLALAQFLKRSGDIDGALKRINEAINLAPKDLEALMAKADVLAVKKDTKGVQATLARIKEAYPDKSIGYYQMGQYYMGQKRFDQAIAEFEQALAKSGDELQILSAITNARLAQGKPDKAMAGLRDVLKKHPDHPVAHELIAEVHITQKQYNEAEKELREAIRVNPQWNVPYRNLANLYLVRGDFPAAEEIYRQGLQAIPEDMELLVHLSEAYERTKNFDKAIDAYERILKKNPDMEIAINNLASLLTDYKGDSGSLKRARELAARFESSQQPAFRDTLAWIYFKTGEIDKSIALLENIVKQAPNNRLFSYHLGMAYYKKGDMPSAKIHLTKALEGKGAFLGADEARATLNQIP